MNSRPSSEAEPSVELEREVENTRESMVQTLDQIRERVSPSNVVDQALDYARHSGAPAVARQLGQTVRKNPLPLLLIGAGVGWLIASNRRKRHHAADTSMEPYADVPVADPAIPDTQAASVYGVESGAPQGEPRSDGAGSRSERSASEKLAGAQQSAEAGLDAARQGAKAKLSDLSARASGAVTDARLKLRSAGDHAKQSWTRTVEEQPLLLVGAGFALGAAIGALLPPTQAERRALGPASDDIKARAREAAAEKLRQARENVRETADAVVSDLQERGYSKSGAKDAARAAAERTTAAVQGSERSH